MSNQVNSTGLTCERVQQLLTYNPGTGVITWLVRRGKVKAGSVAGTPDKDGYVTITLDGKKRKAHRLAWVLHHGVWPSAQIDHRNTVKSDNWIDNLRDATPAVNKQNVRSPSKRNKLGVLGVVRSGKKFKSTYTAGGSSHHVGTFKSSEDAHAAYLSAKRLAHPGCTL